MPLFRDSVGNRSLLIRILEFHELGSKRLVPPSQQARLIEFDGAARNVAGHGAPIPEPGYHSLFCSHESPAQGQRDGRRYHFDSLEIRFVG